ncbi:TPA: hypothetical protein DDW35_07710, partial [Candidatus Sumerlaeota bacterium]|nr:hypothetical protein [Candidatus Sumerlaeota bacterium]
MCTHTSTILFRLLLCTARYCALGLLMLGGLGCASFSSTSSPQSELDLGAARDVADVSDAGTSTSLSAKNRPATGTKPDWDTPPVRSVAVNAANGSNALASGIYTQLSAEPNAPKNLCFSPYAAANALALAYAGAAGATESQMAGALHLPNEQATLHPSFNALALELQPPGQKNKTPFFTLSHALWACKNAGVQANYSDFVRHYYGGVLEALDFERTPSQALERINAWAAEKTNKKIIQIPMEPFFDMRLALTNTLVIKAEWLSAFDPKDTRFAPFHCDGIELPRVPLMHQTRTFRYAETDALQVLEMPFKDSAFSLCALLPKAGNTAKPAEDVLAKPETLNQCLAMLQPRRVAVAFPRIRPETYFSSPIAGLKALSVRDAFTPGVADFSGMNGVHDLYLNTL